MPSGIYTDGVRERAGEMWPERAARNAADVIQKFPDVIKAGKDMSKIKGIGKGTIKKVGLLGSLFLYSALTPVCCSQRSWGQQDELSGGHLHGHGRRWAT